MHPNHRSHPRRAFALLLTLIVLALVATVLTQACSISLAHALEASTATEQLQRRWGERSCQASLLPICETVLVDAEARGGIPTPTSVRTLSLGGQRFDLVFTDEQARVNVNALLTRMPHEAAATAIAVLLAHTSRHVPIVITPALTSDDTAPTDRISAAGTLPGVASFTQIFPDTEPGTLLGNPASIDGPTSIVTCWGDGKINWRRASNPSIDATCGQGVDATLGARLHLLMQQTPGANLDQLMTMLEASDQDRLIATQNLKNGSSCHGLWIVSHRGFAIFYTFCVHEEFPNGVDRTHRMTW